MSQVPPSAPPPTMGYETPGTTKPQTLALVSLILGIGSFVLCWIPIGPVSLGMFLAIGAIVVGMMAKGAIKRGEQTGNGMATAGLILGGVNLLLTVVFLILALVLGAGALWFMGKAAEEAERQQRESGGGATTEPVEMFRMAIECAATIVRSLLR